MWITSFRLCIRGEAHYTSVMAGFNHYAKLKRILEAEPAGWYIAQIDEKTTATTFRGEKRNFDHYYRLYRADGTQIKYGKFQQLDLLAQALSRDPLDLPLVNN